MPRRTSEAVHGHFTQDPSNPPATTNPSFRHDSSRPNVDKHLPDVPPSTNQPRFDNFDIPALRQKPVRDNPSTTPSKHTRSFSHPFPSLFGPRRSVKDSNRGNGGDANNQDSDSTGDDRMRRMKEAPKSPSRNISRVELQPVTGRCMACDSTVRWPQGLKVYRCTTCLTINDLEPFTDPDNDLNSGSPSPSHLIDRKPVPISIERTRLVIESCIMHYFKQRLDHANGQHTSHSPSSKGSPPHHGESAHSHQSPATFSTFTTTNGTMRGLSNQTTSESGHQNLQSHLPTPLKNVPHPSNGLATRPSESPSQRQRSHVSQETEAFNGESTGESTMSNAIFRTLENYIAISFSGCAVLNASFLTTRTPNSQLPSSHIDQSKIRQVSEPLETPTWEPDAFLSEVDAKTLLLADVAENGSWWTGSRPRGSFRDNNRPREPSPEKLLGAVTAKSPKIDWADLAEWYRIILHAGDNWRQHHATFRKSLSPQQQSLFDSVGIGSLQQHFADSQIHLHRSLLKSTENLLKRPRRPLKSAEDSRFLLMLFVNPLLYPGSTSSSHIDTPTQSPHKIGRKPLASESSPFPTRRKPTINKKHGNLGHHSGILKRVIGLMANLPNEVHQFMISWFARFSDVHFQRMVDMVGGFVTYRLARQQNRPSKEAVNPTDGLVPSFSDSGLTHPSQLHAALEVRPSTSSRIPDGKPKLAAYSEDWQVRGAARVMALLFQANTSHSSRKRDHSITWDQRMQSAGLNAKYQANLHGQVIPISNFYNTMLDYADLVADFEAWEVTKTRFTFCQYPFFLSIYAKIHILEYDARRQMEVKAREAFFDSILSRKAVSQYLVFRVRRECLVEDSLRNVREVVGTGAGDIKKGLRIDFAGEEGVDAGGLRKEWFLLLIREIFDPEHGLFVYDDDSQYCYFNPFCFESSEQFFLVGVLLGLAIYNSTILDVAFPPFVFKKMLSSAPSTGEKLTSIGKPKMNYTLEDLAEFRPSLARGLRQLLEFEGDVQETFCRDFVIEMDRYGELVRVPLCPNGEKRPVTNATRRDFVDLYIHHLLDTAVARQYEPFKRGFFTVCGGNALSLFRPEEIELLVRGSDEPLDITSLRAVATYEGWPTGNNLPPDRQPQVEWFWDFFGRVSPADQRKILSFITGSDRIPAMGATNLLIRIIFLHGDPEQRPDREIERFPIARTCFNTLGLYAYRKRQTLEEKLWMAVLGSEGFGLK